MGKFLLTAFLLIASATIQAQVQKNNVSKKTVLIKINIEANGQFQAM